MDGMEWTDPRQAEPPLPLPRPIPALEITARRGMDQTPSAPFLSNPPESAHLEFAPRHARPADDRGSVPVRNPG